MGTRLIALRCAGFNHVDLKAAGRLGLTVARVPAYSPHAVAEFTLGGLAIDAYEQEADLFFEDLSNQILADDVFAAC